LGMRTQRQIQFMVALYSDVLRVQNDVYDPDELDGMGVIKPQLPVIPKVTTEQRPSSQQRRVSLPLEGAPQVAPPAAGRMLGRRYRLERMSGQGGMGTVWRAFDVTLGDRPVALKVLRLEGFEPEQRQAVLTQFEQEARLLATLDHPGIVPVTDFFTEGETPYLVMGWVEGKPLCDVLADNAGPIAVPQALTWGLEIANVLGYLHSRTPPVLFRDLKPDNVMLMENGRLRLVDFGLARPSDKRTATALRGIGTSGFSPPEQYGEGSSDTRTDVYSLGATLYNLLTATRPPPSISLLLGDLSLIRPRAINGEVPQWLDDLVVHMMAPRKDERPQSVLEIRQALETNRAI
ncbi:MAG: serine/threonine-protein kinase, partial [Candidatus Xenobia bacterium]